MRATARAWIAALAMTAFATPAAAAENRAAVLLSLINQFRVTSGLAPLDADSRLATVARLHGEDMTARAYFAHVTPEGGDLGDRLWNIGYRFAVAAENLARGYRDATAVLAGWQGSPGHLANLLRTDVSAVGIAIAGAPAGRDGGPVWVLVLAEPRS